MLSSRFIATTSSTRAACSRLKSGGTITSATGRGHRPYTAKATGSNGGGVDSMTATQAQDGGAKSTPDTRDRAHHHRHPAQPHGVGLSAKPLPPRTTPTATHTADIKHGLRVLLRETAQPVAVVTSFMPCSSAESGLVGEEELGTTQHTFHGATLSSFTSIAMDPHPLVAFALRIPSRMASTLTSFTSHLPPPLPLANPATPSPAAGSAAHKSPKEHQQQQQQLHAHMVVNLLAHDQADVAHRFARADLFPHPFTDVPYTLSREGLPVLTNSIGAISCRLVAQPLKLSALGGVANENGTIPNEQGTEQVQLGDDGGVVSELFIAQVVRIENLPPDAKGDLGKGLSPLLYHRRKYTSC